MQHVTSLSFLLLAYSNYLSHANHVVPCAGKSASPALLKSLSKRQKIVLKVNFHCRKCKTRVLLAVTKLTGIDEVSFDGEKGTVVVIGDADPVCVATRVRKTGMIAEIESVGPIKKSEDPPKPPKLLRLMNPLPPYGCEGVAIGNSLPYNGGNCMIITNWAEGIVTRFNGSWQIPGKENTMAVLGRLLN
ncbi:hypothetical protein L6452_01727 [Arctium lappa]|uniref:Uncharacterized protein n=1 Tax=Arctium lappa TaxID=4217 RepID=A0ACB9FGX5_ARCLA|nr:hypothetical protein L6452_01727 [Arctium lappa]